MDFHRGIKGLIKGLRKYKLRNAITHIMSDIEYEILRTAKDGDINCTQALAIAKKYNVAPKEVGAKIDELGIKIHNCQLGCFE